MARASRTAGLAAIAGLVTGQAALAEAFVVEPDARSRIEAVVSKGGAKVHYFPGPIPMIGVGLTMASGKQMVVYATPDGRTLFSGVALDTATGENLARRDLASKLPAPDLSGLPGTLRKAAGVTLGSESAPAEFFVFVDPHCPYCHKAYEVFEQLAASRQDFKVHWIPVGILGPRSENGAKAILGAGGRAGELLAGYMREGTPVAAPGDIAAGDKAHQANVALYRSLQFSGVPVVVSARGNAVHVQNGLPALADLAAVLDAPRVAMK
jgi:thiol:disulfide interchange protein DsbG